VSGGGRRLSLRARMLVVLIGVTSMVLLVMGIVSTVILDQKLTGQFKAHLATVSTWSLGQISTHANGYAAVWVDSHGGSAQPLTDSALTGSLTTAVRRLIQRDGLQPQTEPLKLSLHAGPTMLAMIRSAPDEHGDPGTLVVAQATSAATQQLRPFIIAELITGGALIGLLAIGGEWLIGRGLEPLGRMASAANDITSRGDLTARMPDVGDQTEVGMLGSAINTMLDRIQQAFGARLRSEQKVREFAADASHELRTPLTTIRGYAELYRQGALGPDQLPSAMRRIEQEAERMSTLVAELLELARLDRTSSLDLTETDLAGIVRDAVADAVAVEPQRPVRAEAPPRLVAVVDEPRIRQVLANLLGNVRAHTPVSTPVAVRLGTITGGVLLEVADAGPGMSGEDAARAFDRFHRAADRQDENGQVTEDRSAPDDERSGGSGLGLSIVQAIAGAHGGRATLESWPGRGTKVRVWLPVRAAT
jgi:signal transduction histidine kinase